MPCPVCWWDWGGSLQTTSTRSCPVQASPSCRTDSSHFFGLAEPRVRGFNRVLKGISVDGEVVVGKLWAPAGGEADLEAQLAMLADDLPTAVPVVPACLSPTRVGWKNAPQLPPSLHLCLHMVPREADRRFCSREASKRFDLPWETNRNTQTRPLSPSLLSWRHRESSARDHSHRPAASQSPAVSMAKEPKALPHTGGGSRGCLVWGSGGERIKRGP